MNVDDLLAQLVEVLDEEVERLVDLRFRLVAIGALVATDQVEWLPQAVRELERSSEELRLADLRRAVATTGVTTACHLDPEARLHELAEQVAEGWGEVLRGRRRQLLEELADVQNLAELTTSAVGQHSELVQEALTFLRSNAGSAYSRHTVPRAPIVQGAM